MPVPLVMVAFVSEELEDAAVLAVPLALPAEGPLLLPLAAAAVEDAAAASPLLFLNG